MSNGEPTRESPTGPIGTTVLFENDHVRVWSMDVAAGGRKPWHHHRLPYVIVPVSGGRIEIEANDGSIVRIDELPGEAIWRDAGEIHELRNRGAVSYRNVLIEIKAQPSKAGVVGKS